MENKIKGSIKTEQRKMANGKSGIKTGKKRFNRHIEMMILVLANELLRQIQRVNFYIESYWKQEAERIKIGHPVFENGTD